VGRETKTGIGLAIVILLGLLAYSELSPRAGILVLAIGLLVLVLVLFGTGDSSATSSRPRFGRRRKDSLLESVVATVERPPTAAPLQPWNPADGLQPWSPPSDLVASPTAPVEPTRPSHDHDDLRPEAPEMPQRAPEQPEPEALDDGTAPAARSDHPWNDDNRWDDRRASFDRNPLDDLDQLDDVDVVAEVERIEARATATGAGPSAEAGAAAGSLFSVPSPINEDVSNDDDIIAASQATELTVARTGNAELAKLLAKVQERLAAYE
jgi:hypothetical protein